MLKPYECIIASNYSHLKNTTGSIGATGHRILAGTNKVKLSASDIQNILNRQGMGFHQALPKVVCIS